MRARETLRHVLGSSVRIQGVRVAHVTGVLLDASETHALGLLGRLGAFDGGRLNVARA